MPELPEVETIRRNVERTLICKTISTVSVRLPKLLRHSPIADLTQLVGTQFDSARRRAKILILDTNDDLSLLVHFKLSGQFAILTHDGQRLVAGHPIPDPMGAYPHKATHVEFGFDDGTVAFYSDIRQFGWFRLMRTTDVEDAIAAFSFGPEGFGSSLDVAALGAKMRARGIPIKTLLLDQTFIAGLGNIYVDEALFDARIHPACPAHVLTGPECTRLLDAVPVALGRGIEQGGATIIRQRAFPIDSFPAVHGREGELCVACGSTIEKIRIGGRGTYLCPRCQRLPRRRKQRLAIT